MKLKSEKARTKKQKRKTKEVKIARDQSINFNGILTGTFETSINYRSNVQTVFYLSATYLLP